jgi:nucleoid DNA-binding protein
MKITKRKLIPYEKRRPKDKLHLTDLADAVSEKTGFKTSDIKLVWQASVDTIIEMVQQHKAVWLPHFGGFYMMLSPPRQVVSMNGGKRPAEKMIAPPVFRLRFREAIGLKDILAKKIPTAEEVEALYED